MAEVDRPKADHISGYINPEKIQAFQERGFALPGDYQRVTSVTFCSENGEMTKVPVRPVVVTNYQDGHPMEPVTVFYPPRSVFQEVMAEHNERG